MDKRYLLIGLHKLHEGCIYPLWIHQCLTALIPGTLNFCTGCTYDFKFGTVHQLFQEYGTCFESLPFNFHERRFPSLFIIFSCWRAVNVL